LKKVEKEGLLDSDETKALKSINCLRNAFAHIPIKHNVDEADVKQIKDALPPKLAKAVEYPARKIYREHGLDTPSREVRIILMVLFNWLRSRSAHERDKNGHVSVEVSEAAD